jgi:carbonic anhydrase
MRYFLRRGGGGSQLKNLEFASFIMRDMGLLAKTRTRRKFLTASAGRFAGVFLAATGTEFVASPRLFAQTRLTPDAALDELLAGNKRFTAGRLTSLKQDLAISRRSTAEKQEPFAAVLSCSDSRVPVEIVFDQSIGQIFVARVAGNVLTPEIIASLEYGVAELGVKSILVLGHSKCGAVSAAMQGKEAPGQISALYPHLQPAVDQAGSNLEAAIKANAKLQSALLRKASTVVSALVKGGKLKVAAGYYDIAAGNVTLLD